MNEMKMPAGKKTSFERMRKEMEARIENIAFPHKHDEYWRYTSPSAFTVSDIAPAQGCLENTYFKAIKTLRIVFVDGLFDARQSDWKDIQNIEAVQIERLADISNEHWAFKQYAALEKLGQKPVPRPLAALNTARAHDGVAIFVKGNVDIPIELVYQFNAGCQEYFVHNLVYVESGDLCLLESGIGGARFNTVLEAHIQKNAQCHHLRVQPHTNMTTMATHIFAEIDQGGALRSFTLNEGAKLTRNEIFVTLKGDKSDVHLGGIFLGQDASHNDDTVFVTHDAVECNSRQIFKKVLEGGAKGVFQGKILVKENAQKTDGYQLSKALILDDESDFRAKPELEIYNDDVVCSHGSTTGTIDRDALFYLRARGIGEKEAKNMLVFSFLAEALDEISDQKLRNVFYERLAKMLEIDYS